MKLLLSVLSLVSFLGVTPDHEPHSTVPISTAARYDSNAGFRQAIVERPRQPITMGSFPTAVSGFTTSNVAWRWSATAGWYMFSMTGSPTSGQIVFEADMSSSDPRDAFVERIRGSDGWFVKCIVHYNPDAAGSGRFMNQEAFVHEVGHCLGFMDHVSVGPSGCAGTPPQCAPPLKQCNQPTLPSYSDYTGIMSYCTWNQTSLHMLTHDRATLRDTGYRPYGCDYPYGSDPFPCSTS